MTEQQMRAQRVAEFHFRQLGYEPPVPMKDSRGRRPKGSVTVAQRAAVMQISERAIYHVGAVRRRNPWLHQYLVTHEDCGIKHSDALRVADRCVPLLQLAIQRVDDATRKMTLTSAVLDIEAEIYAAYEADD